MSSKSMKNDPCVPVSAVTEFGTRPLGLNNFEKYISAIFMIDITVRFAICV